MTTAARPRPNPPLFDVDALIRDPKIKVIVTCGSGGVGKTTTAAAVAVRAAEHGRRVVVLTIDPARRLAQSLGLTELDNTPRHVDGVADGALLAMMLDMKRTFDDVVAQHTTPERAAAIYANPFYQSLSASFAGTQEYMAMEKLSQLRSEMIDSTKAEWDLIVVDTPPSRSALDFLDAPKRLERFLDGRLVRLLAVPARASGRAGLKVMSAGFSVVTKAITRILGADLLTDVSSFVAALETMFGGFRERAEETYKLLKAPDTAFVVVASPEPDALREASFFVERLQQERMPLAGVVVNRMRGAAPGLTPQRATAALDDVAELLAAARDSHQDPEVIAALTAVQSALAVHVECATASAHDQAMAVRFAAAHPDVAQRKVPALATDVHDLDGLRTIGETLAG